MPGYNTNKRRECFRCSDAIEPPVDENAMYVIGADMVVQEQQEVIVAHKHTQKTKDIREKLVQAHGIDPINATQAIARQDPRFLKGMANGKPPLENSKMPDSGPEFDFTDLTADDFQSEEVQAPVSPEQDPEVVRSVVTTKQKEVQKTGIICLDCHKDSDTVIW